MATKTDMTEHHICDLCGAEMGQDELVTLYRTDNKLSGRQAGRGGQARVADRTQ